MHCSDVSFIDEIYTAPNRKRDKGELVASGMLPVSGGLSTVDHNLHRARQTPVMKFFSRGMITRLEDEVHEMTQAFCNKLLRFTDEPIDLSVPYTCLGSDIICSYCFGETFGFIDQEGWEPNFHHAELSTLRPTHLFRLFPYLKKLAPFGDRLINYLPADIALLIRTYNIDIPNHIKKIKADMDAGTLRDRPTIFRTLLELKPEQKRVVDLHDEAITLLGAGTETVSWALAVITFHILNSNERCILEKLTAELNQVVKDPRSLPRWNELEKLPYLQAVIKEGLRLSYGIAGRSARVPKQENLFYRGEWQGKPVEYVIPQGYAIGTSNALTHHDESIFPDSHSFIPERWMDVKEGQSPERGFMAFSRGSRACVGKNLAYCELNVVLSALVLRVMPRMRLFETTAEDVAYAYDMVIPMPRADSKGVRVVISPT